MPERRASFAQNDRRRTGDGQRSRPHCNRRSERAAHDDIVRVCSGAHGGQGRREAAGKQKEGASGQQAAAAASLFECCLRAKLRRLALPFECKSSPTPLCTIGPRATSGATGGGAGQRENSRFIQYSVQLPPGAVAPRQQIGSSEGYAWRACVVRSERYTIAHVIENRRGCARLVDRSRPRH